MLKKFLIVFNFSLAESDLEMFTNVVASNYLSMRGGSNVIVLLSADENALQIFNKLDMKTDYSINFIVSEISSNWYGNLPDEVFDWLHDKFPEEGLHTQ